MRERDKQKEFSIYEAAIELINEIGFAETSMSKIAKKAKLSSSTIYVYFENKEDMLNKVYLRSKQKFSEVVLKEINENMSFDFLLETLFHNTLKIIDSSKKYFLFMEQFANSPMVNKVSKKEAESMFTPLYAMFEKARKEKVIKDYPTELLLAYTVMPLMQLAQLHINGQFQIDDQIIQQSLELAKSAIMI